MTTVIIQKTVGDLSCLVTLHPPYISVSFRVGGGGIKHHSVLYASNSPFFNANLIVAFVLSRQAIASIYSLNNTCRILEKILIGYETESALFRKIDFSYKVSI